MIKVGDKVKIVGPGSYNPATALRNKQFEVIRVDVEDAYAMYNVRIGTDGDTMWFPAMSVEEIKAIPDGYTVNTTGKKPVGTTGSSKVEVVLKDGSTYHDSKVSDFRWNFLNNSDIAYYKLLDVPAKSLAQQVAELAEHNERLVADNAELKKEIQRLQGRIAAVVKAVA